MQKNWFFWFFDFLPNARGPLKIFDAQFTDTFKKNSKNGLSGICLVPKGTKSWILVSLALFLRKRQTVFGHLGHNGPPPCRIGLRYAYIHYTNHKFLIAFLCKRKIARSSNYSLKCSSVFHVAFYMFWWRCWTRHT